MEAGTMITDANAGIVRSFVRELRASRKSPRTIQSYQESIGLLESFLAGKDLAEVTKANIQKFMDDQLRRHRPGSAAVRYRALRRFTAGWRLRS
jgi:site-specific recombinase XerD